MAINNNSLNQAGDIISPAVVTSKSAQKDLENIRSQHADIVTGMNNQSIRIQQNHVRRAADIQSENVMKNEMDKASMVANTQAQKNALDFATKQGELDIKRASLS